MKEFNEFIEVNEAKESGIDIAKRVLKNKQHEKGIDLFSAGAVMQIYNALSPKNQKSMASMPTKQMLNVVWKLVGKMSKDK